MDRPRIDLLITLLIALFLCAFPVTLNAGERSTTPDDALLYLAKIGTDPGNLLNFLRQRCSSDEDLVNLERLIRQMGNSRFEERERAAEKLKTFGILALAALREASKDSDLEIARRANVCIRHIQRNTNFALPRAVVRSLVRRRVQSAPEVLLRYLPYAAYDPELEEEIWFDLDKLVANDSKLVRVFADALEDPLPARRAVAAYLLGRRGNLEQQLAAEKAFKDTDPLVVLRAAQGLLGSRRKRAIPALIGLLGSAPLDIAWQAEEMLHWAASADDPPTVSLGDGSLPLRKECQSAWREWWARKGPDLDLRKKDKDPRRPVLLLMGQQITRKGQSDYYLCLCGCDGNPHWQCKGISGDAQLLRGGRLLVLNGSPSGAAIAQRGKLQPPAELITGEWDLRGKLVRRYQTLRFPVFCCRLPNGNTFLGGRQQYQELSSNGSQVYSQLVGRIKGLEQFHSPQMTPRGTILVRLDNGNGVQGLAEFDPPSKTILVKTTLRVGVGSNATVEPLPNGNYLLADPTRGRVLEVDRQGNLVWQHAYPQVMLAARLRDGSTIIGSRRGTVFEVDAKGQTVWEVFQEDNNCWFRPCLALVRLGFDAPRPPGFDLAQDVHRRAKGLESSDVIVRRRFAQSLEDLGHKAEPAIPALIRALGDSDTRVVQYAENALAGLQSSAVLALLQAIQKGDPKIRVEAINILTRGGNTRRCPDAIAPVLLDALKDDRAEVRSAAANVLGGLPQHASEVVPALMRAVDDNDHEVRLLATHSLGLMGSAGRQAIPLLIENLGGKDVQLRGWSAAALGKLGPIDPSVLPALIQFLRKESNAFNRDAAAHALGRMGAQARDAVPALIEALKVTDLAEPKMAWMSREAVIQALGDIGPEAKAAVPELIRIMRDGEAPRGPRITAIRSLGKIGSAARDAIPFLAKEAKGSYSPFKEAAAEALKRITRN